MNQDPKSFGRPDAENLVRQWNLFFNRTVAYSFDHPVAQETIPKTFDLFLKCQGNQGSLSILLQEFGYYIGHVDLVYQPNNRRIADHLRRFGIESISMAGRVSLADFSRFLDACSLTHANPTKFLQYLTSLGINSFTVNDVSLKTVKDGESPPPNHPDTSQGMTWDLGDEDGGGGGSGSAGTRSGWLRGSAPRGGAPRGGDAFEEVAMRVVLGHITAQEMTANLGFLRVLETPSALPEAILKAAHQQGGNIGAESVKQSLLNVVGAFKTSATQENVPVEELLAGMYNMRAELLKAVKAQQGIAQHLANREDIYQATDDIFVATAAQLVMTEYQKCKGNPKRMAQVIQRIVPEKHHLEKVLAAFRAELLKLGVPLIEFYNLLTELNSLMGADKSYQEFLQAGKSLGINSDELLRELQENPMQAAQLIVLASEARKMGKGGNGEDLVRSLADYVEKAGETMGTHVAQNPREAAKAAGMLIQMEAEMNRELQQKAIPEDVRQMGQQKLRLRMQKSVADIKGKAALAQLGNPGMTESEKIQFMMEIFSDEKEMDDVMGAVRDTLSNESVVREVGNQVMQKVRQQMNSRRDKHYSKELPAGVYVKAVLDFFVKSEISRAVRYDLPFTVILLSFQGLPEDKASLDLHGDSLRGLQNVLIGDLRKCLRESDFVGYLTFNRFLAVLPMTRPEQTPAIIKKFQDNLSRQVALPDGNRLYIRPRYGIAAFDKETANTYQKIYAELMRSWQSDA